MKRRRRRAPPRRRKGPPVRKARKVRRAAPPAPPPARRPPPDEPDSWLLLTMLEVAVPLWIHELRNLHPHDRVALAHELADTVASKGDILMFRSKKAGQTADQFNATARALAAMAYQPGGVRFCGRHWEAT